MTPEELFLKQYKLVIIENIITLIAIVGIAFAFGWPFGLCGFILIFNLTIARKKKP